MEVYFVRHGETTANLGHRHQPGRTRLTVRGEEQARTIAKKAASFQPTHLITSSQVRAVETARVIVDTLDVIPQTNESFQELIRPEHVIGHKHMSFRSMLYMLRWYLGWGGNGAGETYTNFLTRLQEAKRQLEAFPGDARVVIISHSIFINFFVAHMCRGGKIASLHGLKSFYEGYDLTQYCRGTSSL